MKSFIIVILVLHTIIVIGQPIKRNVFCVKYTFEHIRDTMKMDKVSTYEEILIVSPIGSMYGNYASIVADSIMNKMVHNQESFNALDQQIFNDAIKKSKGFEKWYMQFSNKKTIQQIQWLNEELLINYDFPDFKWKINDSIKIINGFECKQAEGNWKGRSYIAWFASKVQTSAGPWKAIGLPGLIVWLYDSKRHLSWKVSETFIPNNNINIDPSKKGTFVTKKQYDEMVAAAKKDLNGFIKANQNNIQSMYPGVSNTTISVTPKMTNNPKTFNNPIELEN